MVCGVIHFLLTLVWNFGLKMHAKKWKIKLFWKLFRFLHVFLHFEAIIMLLFRWFLCACAIDWRDSMGLCVAIIGCWLMLRLSSFLLLLLFTTNNYWWWWEHHNVVESCECEFFLWVMRKKFALSTSSSFCPSGVLISFSLLFQYIVLLLLTMRASFLLVFLNTIHYILEYVNCLQYQKYLGCDITHFSFDRWVLSDSLSYNAYIYIYIYRYMFV